MNVRNLIASAALVALATAPALSAPSPVATTPNPAAATVLNINMGAQNGSGQDGTASVTDVPGGVSVKLQLSNTKGSEPAHIHKGTCAKLDPAPWKPLSDVVNGVSITVVKGVSVADLKNGQFAINVHESPTNLTRYVSCGDL